MPHTDDLARPLTDPPSPKKPAPRARAPSVRLAPPSSKAPPGRKPSFVGRPGAAAALAAVEAAFERPVQEEGEAFHGPGGVLPPGPARGQRASSAEKGRRQWPARQAGKRRVLLVPPPAVAEVAEAWPPPLCPSPPPYLQPAGGEGAGLALPMAGWPGDEEGGDGVEGGGGGPVPSHSDPFWDADATDALVADLAQYLVEHEAGAA